MVLLGLSLQLHAQQAGYEVAFHQVFDNREYFTEYAFPQTIFGARLDGSLRFELDSSHAFFAGINYFYEHGSTILALPPQVNLYYRYRSETFDMAMGAFPRKERLTFAPAFLHDTLQYYRPNVEGAFISYAEGPVEVSGFADWTGWVSEERRETFLAGTNVKLHTGNFFLQGAAIMYHNARSYSPADHLPLQDNGIWSVLLGYSNGSREDALTLETSAGFLSSWNRYRPDPVQWSRGMIFNIDMTYTFFGLKGVYYYGTPVDFTYGDPFYRSGNYGRLDLFADPFRHPGVSSKIGWSLHAVPGEGVYHSQQILISVAF